MRSGEGMTQISAFFMRSVRQVSPNSHLGGPTGIRKQSQKRSLHPGLGEGEAPRSPLDIRACLLSHENSGGNL